MRKAVMTECSQCKNKRYVAEIPPNFEYGGVEPRLIKRAEWLCFECFWSERNSKDFGFHDDQDARLYWHNHLYKEDDGGGYK